MLCVNQGRAAESIDFSVESSQDTIKIGVGANKRVTFILSEDDDISNLQSIDINRLIKSTYEEESKKGSDLSEIEILFDEEGESRVIVEASTLEEFKSLVNLDFNKMVDITAEQAVDSKGKVNKRVVVDATTTAKYRKEKIDSSLVRYSSTIESVTPTYSSEITLVGDTIAEISSYLLNIGSVGVRKVNFKDYCYSGLAMDIGVNNWIESDPKPENNLNDVKLWGSWNFSMKYNYTHHFGPLHRSNFGVSFLLGFDWYNFKFQDRSSRIAYDDDGPYFYKDPLVNGGNARKSKLMVSYLTATVMPEIIIGNSRVAAGGYGSLKLGNKTKYKVTDTSDKNKIKDSSVEGVNQFRYGVRGEIGNKRGDSALYFAYDLNDLFEDSSSLNLNPYTVGVIFKW